MHHIQGIGRGEILLFPPSLEESLHPDSIAWVIEAFVNRLDLKDMGFQRVEPAWTGRPGYAPWILLKLLLYGMLEDAESARKMEKETYRNMEVMWLTQMQHPDFKTIADFRRENEKALQRVGCEFMLLCEMMDLVGKKTVAIDGSKFKAVNALRKSFTKKHLQQKMQKIAAKVQKYLQQLEEADQQEEASPPGKHIQEKIQRMQEYHQHCQKILAEMEAQGKTQICLTDPDSRVMKSHGISQPSYNVQTVVDAKHKLIVTHEVTQDCEDKSQLEPMAKQAQGVLEVKELEVLADTGYYNGEQIAHCEEAGMTCYVPPPEEKNPEKTQIFATSAFVYDAKSDTYSCPAGAMLTYERTETTDGRERRIYQTSACGNCFLKSRCTKAKEGRMICRYPFTSWREKMHQRGTEHPEKISLRRCLSEHPFGTLKRSLRHRQILMRGLPQVKMEFSLRVLTYNIKRVKQILGVPKLHTLLTKIKKIHLPKVSETKVALQNNLHFPLFS